MNRPNLKTIELQGFRSYGAEQQIAEINAPIAVFWGPNSKGKTSFAEAIEFLLTGQIVKREILASRQDEFTDALRHAHLDDNVETFVAATVQCSDGILRKIKRVLNADYAKQGGCVSTLYIDDQVVEESTLSDIGIVLLQPPLIAPVLAQHTLNYLFTAKSSDRASYFKALLEATDLDEFRASVTTLEQLYSMPGLPLLEKLTKVASIDVISRHVNDTSSTDLVQLENSFLDGSKAVLEAEEIEVPEGLPQRIEAIKTALEEKRAKHFPLHLLTHGQLTNFPEPTNDVWEILEAFLVEKQKIDDETKRLIVLFKAALEIPSISEANDKQDCPLCGSNNTLTPERIELIRKNIAATEAFQTAKTQALNIIRTLRTQLENHERIIESALPQLVQISSRERKQSGFTFTKLHELLGEGSDKFVAPWIITLRALLRQSRDTKTLIKSFSDDLSHFIDDPNILLTIQPLKENLATVIESNKKLLQMELEYVTATESLHQTLKTLLDQLGDTEGWAEFIDLGRALPELRLAIIERTVRLKLISELKASIKAIDKGIGKVLDDKFCDLSKEINTWWELLRGGDSTFFSAVQRRGKNTIDFKAGLATPIDANNPKMRDVIAVFSDSQLHCLGLAIFLARAERYGSGFVVLDDPVQSSDEDYRVHFRHQVINRLHGEGIQVIVLTQHKNTRRDIATANEHLGVDQFQIEIPDPAKGSVITKTDDELSMMLASASPYTTTDTLSIRKDGGRKLRDATERFCKMLLVRKRKEVGEERASISDYDGETLGGDQGLVSKVVPHLTLDNSHAGKMRVIRDDLNPSSHDDDDVPTQQALKEALGNLRRFQKDYLLG